MKTYIYFIVLSILVPFIIGFFSGSFTIHDTELEAQDSILNLGYKWFVCCSYLSSGVALAYGILVRKEYFVAKLWKTLLITVFIILILPLAFVFLSFRGLDFSNSIENGGYQLGRHAFYIFIVTIVCVFLTKSNTSKVQPVDSGNG